MDVDPDDYLNMTPDELRKEADRRELVERAREESELRAARVAVVELLREIGTPLLVKSKSHSIIKEAIQKIVEDNKNEKKITNGEVHMAGFGKPDNWWEEATKDFPKHCYPDLLDNIEKGRTTVLGG